MTLESPPERARRGTVRAYLDLANVLGGALSRNFLRGALKLLVAGFLTVEAFGILRAVDSLFKIVSGLAALGLDNATVTFLASAIKREDDDERENVLRTVLAIKLLVATLLVVAGVVAGPWVARWALGDPSLTPYARLAILAVGGQLLWKYVSSFLSGSRKYTLLAFFLTTMPLLALTLAATLIVTDLFDLRAAVWIYLLGPAVTALLWLYAVDGRARKPAWDGATARRLIGYGRWIYMSGVVSRGRNHLNPLLLKSPSISGSVRVGELNAGLYGFGNDLANEITIFSESLVAVLLPRAAGKSSRAGLRRLVARSYRKLVLLLVPLGLLVFAAEPLLRLLGRIKSSYLDYLPSIPVFTILYLGALLSLAAIPMRTALHAMRKPQFESYLDLATLPVLIVCSVWLIRLYGAQGAAIAVVIQRILAFVALMTYGTVTLRRADEDLS